MSARIDTLASGPRDPEAAGPASEATGARIEPRESFSSRRVVAVRHDLDRHPLLQLPALAALAQDLADLGQCRYLAPGTRADTPFEPASRDRDGRSIADAFARIEEPGAWVGLFSIESHPLYRELLRSVSDAFGPLVEPEQPGVYDVRGYLFLSAPPALTPFHVDRENNFWLQVRGRKRMTIWEAGDRELLPAAERAAYMLHEAPVRVDLTPERVSRGRTVDALPGEGFYLPALSPHMTRTEPGWTRPGDGVSISLAVTFYTSTTRREARAHVVNDLLRRRLGWTPTEPGERPWLDRAKAPLGAAVVWGRKAFGGHAPQPGMT